MVTGIIPQLQSHGTSTPTARILLTRFSNDAAGAAVVVAKSRGADTASNVVVQSGDDLGGIFFAGADGGSQVLIGAGVQGVADAEWQTSGDTSDNPTRLVFYTTPDGSGTLTERMRIDSNGLITGTGTSLGAWTAYTPTLGGTGWAIGNGTATGVYCQIGKTVMGRIRLAFGSTSTYGSATLTASLPVTAINADGPVLATGVSLDVSLSQSYSMNISGNSTALALRVLGTKGVGDPLISTEPFTWATSDEVRVSFSYQAA
jgi:hypothetical protein